jgi:hypothetical protein
MCQTFKIVFAFYSTDLLPHENVLTVIPFTKQGVQSTLYSIYNVTTFFCQLIYILLICNIESYGS